MMFQFSGGPLHKMKLDVPETMITRGDGKGMIRVDVLTTITNEGAPPPFQHPTVCYWFIERPVSADPMLRFPTMAFMNYADAEIN